MHYSITYTTDVYICMYAKTALHGEGMTKLDQSPPLFIASLFTALQTVIKHTKLSQSSFNAGVDL